MISSILLILSRRRSDGACRRALESEPPWLGLICAFALCWGACAQPADSLIVHLRINASLKYHFETNQVGGVSCDTCFYHEVDDDQLVYTYEGDSTYDLIQDPDCESPVNRGSPAVSGTGSSLAEGSVLPEKETAEWVYSWSAPGSLDLMPLLGIKPNPSRGSCSVYGTMLASTFVQSALLNGNGSVVDLCGNNLNTLLLNCLGSLQTFELPTDKTQYTVTWIKNGTVDNLPLNQGRPPGRPGARWEVTVTFQVDVVRNPAEWEAVIVTDLGLPGLSYEEWLPTGGRDEQTSGSNLPLRVELRAKGTTNATTLAKAKFTYSLTDVSREPGVCMNAPRRDQPASMAKDQNWPPDLKLRVFDNLRAVDTKDFQVVETVQDTAASIAVVDCYDYGAFGTLKITVKVDDGPDLVAHRDGHPEEDFLRIPMDENQNRIADAFEKGLGVYARNLPPEWDRESSPVGQKSDGDGLSFYEEYRGFFIQGVYQRLDPQTKDVFINDIDGLVFATLVNADTNPNLLSAAGIMPHLILDGEWTGSGDAGDGHRVVNFNSSGFAHIVDQHGSDVHISLDSRLDVARNQPATTYPDDSFHGPGGPGDWFFSRIRPWVIEQNILKEVQYHLSAGPLFTGLNDPDLPASDRAKLNQLLIQAADDYLAKHPQDAEQASRLWYGQIITHELCHTLNTDDHHPSSGGDHACIMRYLPMSDFAPDPADPFCLKRRKPWPALLCRTGDACWTRVQVSDLAGASVTALSQTHFPAASLVAASSSSRPLPSLPPIAAPSLELSCSLDWPQLYEGDPMTVVVRLQAAQARQALSLRLAGVTNLPPAFSHPIPILAADWPDGLTLNLERVETNGQRRVILGSNDWAGLLVPGQNDALSSRLGLPSFTRQWFVPVSLSQLAPGAYELSLAWNGRGLSASDALALPLPLTAPVTAFTVVAPTNATAQATHLGRLAVQAYLAGQLDSARSLGEAALSLQGASLSGIEPINTRLLVADIASQQHDYHAAYLALGDLLRQWPNPGLNELGRQILLEQQSLLPTLRLDWSAVRNSSLLTILAKPTQVIIAEESVNLQSWVPFSTNRIDDSGQVTLTPSPSNNSAQRFYRAQWLP